MTCKLCHSAASRNSTDQIDASYLPIKNRCINASFAQLFTDRIALLTPNARSRRRQEEDRDSSHTRSHAMTDLYCQHKCNQPTVNPLRTGQGQRVYMMAPKVSLAFVVEGAKCWPWRSPLFVPTLKKFHLQPSERDREFLPSVFYTPAAKCAFTRRLARPRHTSPTEV